MAPALSLRLMDAIETADSTEKDSERAAKRQIHLAEELISASLDEYRHICALDKHLPGEEPEPFNSRVAEVLRKGYEQWATQAEALLARIAPLHQKHEIKLHDDLALAVGRTQAMLTVSMEAIEKGMEQIRNGEFVTLEEIRRELRDKRGN